MSDDKTTAAVIDLLCEKFPRCFVQDEAHRRPLKVGIFKDLRSALKGMIGSRALSRALQIYTEGPRRSDIAADEPIEPED